MILYTADSEETIKLGMALAFLLNKGDIVAFTGDLGSGKTTMIKGIVANLTGKNATSPTFVLVNEYPGKIPVFHFDLYRIKYIRELSTIGWDEYLGKGIMLVEWAEKIKKLLPGKTIFVKIEPVRGKRRISISGLKKRKLLIVKEMQEKKRVKD
ncbi:MAG TPA: tRNA (adenosine(37)-N6)-threonylcarbamoyltransferase complex ATPase subunit type 1 TsaE [bacterium]|nr:tRNA (adenosine(37)-N6)-threonylcarbamoyltransferase complex ATPase subunit type 1 TsaE [bacterium]